MKITLDLKCCKHCIYYKFIGNDGEFLEDSKCYCTLDLNTKIDTNKCDNFSINQDILDEIIKFSCDYSVDS